MMLSLNKSPKLKSSKKGEYNKCSCRDGVGCGNGRMRYIKRAFVENMLQFVLTYYLVPLFHYAVSLLHHLLNRF